MTDAAAARVGLYGGTFNPIHLGHLRAAEEVAEALGLERVVFIPSARPPHKRHGPASGVEDRIAPAELRLAWTRLAIADNPRFAVDPIEVERAGPSYLVDTLREFGRRTAPDRPVFIVGRDAFSEMDGWKDPETLFTLADFAVTTRPPAPTQSLEDCMPLTARQVFEVSRDGLSAVHERAGTRLQLLRITALDISASAVRARAFAGRSLRYLVPQDVAREIAESRAYAPDS